MSTPRFARYSMVLACAMMLAGPVEAAPPARLDLRPPAATDLVTESADSLHALRSARGEVFAARESATEEHRALPLLASAAGRMPGLGNPVGLAQRFRREGLPIAKLWQSHSAFISVGLNPRGKPGIWLVQKIP